jgi:prevent-host-death family protein
MHNGHMAERSIAASEFKAKCLALLDEVAETRQELIVTKRGKPVARVVPAEEPRSLVGTVKFLVSDEELIKPLYEDWQPDFPE